MASAATDVLRGRRGGPYRIGARIAVGGMSEVFLAEAPGGARVVVKRMLPHLAKAKDARSAFAHEAELGARLRDEHLVSVLDDGEDDGTPFLVLSHVDGATLLDVAAPGRLPLSAVLVIAADLLSGLAHLHAAADERGAMLGIVHRDVTPDNALIDREGRVLLADLGIARSRLRGQRTQTGIVRGKAAYLSPEQITGSEVDARADLYSLGAVLFEAATGERHARGDTDIEILRNAENPTFIPPSTRGADPRLDSLLRRALGQFPEDRYPSASAMRREVMVLLSALGDSAENEGRRALAEAVEKAAPRPEPVAPEVSIDKTQTPLLAEKSALAREKSAPAEKSAKTGIQRTPLWIPISAGVAIVALVVGLGPRLPAKEPAPSPATGEPMSSIVPTTATTPFSPEIVVATSPVVSSGLPAPTGPVTAVAGQRTAPLVPGSAPASSVLVPSVSSTVPATSSASAPAPFATASASTTAILTGSSATTAPTSSQSSAPPDKREAVQRRIAAVSAALREAKSRGHDVSSLEDRAAVALQAFLDGRYDDTHRELDAISARIPQ